MIFRISKVWFSGSMLVQMIFRISFWGDFQVPAFLSPFVFVRSTFLFQVKEKDQFHFYFSSILVPATAFQKELPDVGYKLLKWLGNWKIFKPSHGLHKGKDTELHWTSKCISNHIQPANSDSQGRIYSESKRWSPTRWHQPSKKKTTKAQLKRHLRCWEMQKSTILQEFSLTGSQKRTFSNEHEHPSRFCKWDQWNLHPINPT